MSRPKLDWVDPSGSSLAFKSGGQLSDFLTVKEAADILSVSERTVYNALRAGALKGVRIGGRLWRTKREWLEDFGRPNTLHAA